MDFEQHGRWVRVRAFVVEGPAGARIAEMDARHEDGKLAQIGLEEHRRTSALILKYYYLWRRNECRNLPVPTAP